MPLETVTLRNQVKMPLLGLGTYKSEGQEAYNATLAAIQAGYRLIDTARLYGNEELIGRAIIDSKINRSELFITTKVWTTDFGYEKTKTAVLDSLKKLQLDYIDLVLLHWPKSDDLNSESWRALEDLYIQGVIRAIGVSNYLVHHLEHLWPKCRVFPMVNQVELHPLLQQPVIREWCSQHHMIINSYGPLAKGNVFNVEPLQKLAEKYHKSIAQLIVRWGFQQGIIMIPKSVHPERIIENINVLDFSIGDDDMKIIRECNRAKRFYSDPDNIDW